MRCGTWVCSESKQKSSRQINCFWEVRARRGAREQLLVKPFSLEALVGAELCPHSSFSSLWLWEVGSSLSSLRAAEAGGSPGAAGVAHPPWASAEA